MIVLFHLFTKMVQNFCINYILCWKKSWKFCTNETNLEFLHLAERDVESQIKFDPPVYKQRYEKVTQILMNEKWKDEIQKVVDFGCAELSLFVFLKNVLTAREMVFVDIDELLLRDYLFRVTPLNADYLVGRSKPLNVKVFAGSVSDPDKNLLNTDAVVGIEIIEHLYPDVLEALPYNIFSFIHPKLVIFTTPNAEFNVLFQKANKFRHPDHKFEWTREQFETWAINITLRFPLYTVYFDGIGLGPPGTEHLGCCSQLAVFIRKDIICDKCENCTCVFDNCVNMDNLPLCSYGISTYYSQNKSEKIFNEHQDYYKLIKSIDYPYYVDSRTDEEKMMDEIKYRLHLFEHQSGDCYNFDKNRVEIPIKRLAFKTPKFSLTETEVRSLLLKNKFCFEECFIEETNQIETCVVYRIEMDSGGSGSDTGASGYESETCNVDDGQLSDWDEKDSSTCKENKVSSVKTQLLSEIIDNKKKQIALCDSGYQKSSSLSEESNNSSVVKEAVPLDYKSFNESKANEKPNKLSNLLSVFDNFDKINELDAVRKDRKHFNFHSNLPHREVMKKICQEIIKHPVAGPSRDPRKNKQSKKAHSSDSDDSVEDVKLITNCILENSLNKIDCKEDEIPRGHLIQDLILEENVVLEVPLPQPQVAVVEEVVVENGDLANNNRDLEGNNYPADVEANAIEEPVDNAVDNLNQDDINVNNNNEVVEELLEEPAIEEFVEDNIELGQAIELEVDCSSREALVDANSQVDLLEDFQMDASSAMVSSILVSDYTNNSAIANDAVLPREDSSFPNWLLQIFEEAEEGVPEDDLHDEPHFYCQGDGLGVHPSTVAINDDADDEGNESDTDDSSTSDSEDFANAENRSIEDLFISPEENTGNENLVLVGQQIPTEDHNDINESHEQEEIFENAESESNLVTSSCTE